MLGVSVWRLTVPVLDSETGDDVEFEAATVKVVVVGTDVIVVKVLLKTEFVKPVRVTT